MAARIGSRIRQVMALLENREPMTAKQTSRGMECSVYNTSKYLTRAAALNFASCEWSEKENANVYSAKEGWRNKVGPAPGENVAAPPKAPAKHATNTEGIDATIRRRRTHVAVYGMWSGLVSPRSRIKRGES